MKYFKKTILLLVMALVFTGIYVKQPVTSYASDSSNVNKMLSAYKKHNYVTANKYAKKLTSTRDSSERRMTSSMKKAFKNTVLMYYNTSNTWGVYFADMDGDNKAEMLVVNATCLANMTTNVFKYRNGKSAYVGQFPCGHSELVNYPGHRGVIVHFYHMDDENISTVCLRNGKISTNNYGDRHQKYNPYLRLKPLNKHMISNNLNL